MRADRRISATYLFWAVCAGLSGLYNGFELFNALATGRISGRHGQIFHHATEPAGFSAVFSIHALAFLFSVAAAVYILWVRPQAVRGEVILNRRFAARSDLDAGLRATLDPTRQSTDG